MGRIREPYVNLRCDLEGPIAQRFLWLKQAFGLETNAEIVRLAIKVASDAILNDAPNTPTPTKRTDWGTLGISPTGAWQGPESGAE